MNLYATAIGGLEDVAIEEIATVLPDVRVVRQQRGRVYLQGVSDIGAMLRLRSIMNVYVLVAECERVPQDASGLGYIERWLRETDLTEASEAHRVIQQWEAPPKFRVTAERLGEHAYQSPDIAAAAGAGIVERHGWPVSLRDYDIEVIVQLQDGRAEAAVRLSPEALGKRGRAVHGPASLNATVAYAMCAWSDPQPGEVFVDPMCGSGTILLERTAAFDAPAFLVGGDRFGKPLDLARTNIAANGADVALVQWDGGRLALRDESVDKIVCNMPWGRRIGSHRANRVLYREFVSDLARILRPEGKAVLLSLERRLLTSLIERHPGLYFARMRLVSIGGLEPAIYVVGRR